MISIVVPIFNEEESLDKFYAALKESLKKIGKQHEIIFVDDGSTDSTLVFLKKILKKDNSVRIFSFRKNLGKSEALSLAFSEAKGEYIITLDADLQDKPGEIPLILSQLQSGVDVSCGWRKDRKDSYRKKLSSKIFNFLANKIWGLNLHDYNCGLKGYTAEAAKSLNLYGGFHRFIPLLAYDQGFRVEEVAVKHEKRRYGKSKYGFSKLWKDMPDMFTMIFLSRYSKRPLHFFGVAGEVLLLIGLALLVYLSIWHFMGHAIGDRPLLLLGILLVILGLQAFLTGFLADLLVHTNETRKSYPLKYSSD